VFPFLPPTFPCFFRPLSSVVFHWPKPSAGACSRRFPVSLKGDLWFFWLEVFLAFPPVMWLAPTPLPFDLRSGLAFRAAPKGSSSPTPFPVLGSLLCFFFTSSPFFCVPGFPPGSAWDDTLLSPSRAEQFLLQYPFFFSPFACCPPLVYMGSPPGTFFRKFPAD